MMTKALLATAITLIPLTAQAHTRAEIDEWAEGWREQLWEEMITETGLYPTPGAQLLLEELQDVMDRHPWYLNPPARSRRYPTPPPMPPAPGVSVQPGVEQWRGLVAAYFPADQVDRALCIMGYESGGDPNAKNPNSSARGLMQILASLWAPHYGVTYEQLYDPETNMRIAYDIWLTYYWGAWSPYQRGLCR